MGRKNKSKLRKMRRTYGGSSYQAIVTADGKAHPYLNADIPTDRTGQPIAPLEHAVCQTRGRCGHGYSELMRGNDVVCEECRWEDVALLALYILLAYGVDLGVSNYRSGDTEEERESRARLMRLRAEQTAAISSSFQVQDGRRKPSHYGRLPLKRAGYESDHIGEPNGEYL